MCQDQTDRTENPEDLVGRMTGRECPRPADMGSGMASEWNRRLSPDALTGDVCRWGALDARSRRHSAF